MLYIDVTLCKSSLTISSSRTSLADRDQILAASSLTVGLTTEEEGRHTQKKQVDKDGTEDISCRLTFLCQFVSKRELRTCAHLISWLLGLNLKNKQASAFRVGGGGRAL